VPGFLAEINEHLGHLQEDYLVDKIKAGILGFGRMSEMAHLKGMRNCGMYDVKNVCDITESRRARAEELELEATDNLDEFLSSDIEFVVIGTHSSVHYEQALACARAKKHMLIEKPISLTGPEAEKMVAAAKANDVILTAFHNRHFDPDYRTVKQAVRDGLLGDLIHVENRTAGSRPAVGFGTEDFNREWRITKDLGGGTMMDFGPHWTEQVLDLLEGQKVIEVFADVRNLKWGDAEDLFKIDMIFDGGTRATVSKADIAYHSFEKWLVFGMDGTLHGPTQKDPCTVEICKADEKISRTKQVPAFNLHENIAKAIRGEEELIITPDHALRVMQVLQAARDSAAQGKSVTVSI